MGHTFIRSRRGFILALLAWFIGGIGGISIDFDHLLSAITEGGIPWAFLHQPITALVLVGCIVASLGGLVLPLVLRRLR